jgi:cyclase
MLQKRIIFSLLYKDGQYVQSRNFVTNSIGDTDWIIKNYNFENISKYIDELIILDISENKNMDNFLKSVEKITKKTFVPLSLGGGLISFSRAKFFLKNICDKVVVNTGLFSKNADFMFEISDFFGSQSIIASVDFRNIKNHKYIFKSNGLIETKIKLEVFLKRLNQYQIGDILVRSIDRDGTGQGLDPSILNDLNLKKPYIISGGCGNYKHFIDFLKNDKISGISTSNLLNFVGDGLKNLRIEILNHKINLPKWDS